MYSNRNEGSLIKGLSMALFVALFLSYSNPVKAQINYFEDFESLTIGDANSLGNSGWKVFGNVYNGVGSFLYNYGSFPAPNGTSNAFSALNNTVPGPNGGAQYLNVFNDYENGDHGNGNFIEANVFQERTISAPDLGRSYTFTFDHRTAIGGFNPNLMDPNFKDALAFVKVIDQNNGFVLVQYDTLHTAINAAWTEGSTLKGTIDPAWNGFIIQFGFLSRATNYAPTGVYYDNVSFTTVEPIPTLSQWGLICMTLLLMSMSVVVINSRRNQPINSVSL